MPAYKVEICGVNTAKLPILKETEKKPCLHGSGRAIRKQERCISKATCALC